MPELAEVEYYRKRWEPGFGKRVVGVEVHAGARVFRGEDGKVVGEELEGAVLRKGWARGKQMLFGFSGGRWLGVHLGMAGELAVEREGFVPGRHDHLVLRQRGRVLVFRDARMFGRIRFEQGVNVPEWWDALPPGVLEEGFSVERLREAARRRGKLSLKGFLLMQEFFPGIGNWMADEILWRCGWSPWRKAGSLGEAEVRRLRREVRAVARVALRVIGERWGDLPKTWLFSHRWREGGICPKTGVALVRETVAGRTTCWSPGWQR